MASSFEHKHNEHKHGYHPKNCRYYQTNGCRYKSECWYSHKGKDTIWELVFKRLDDITDQLHKQNEARQMDKQQIDIAIQKSLQSQLGTLKNQINKVFQSIQNIRKEMDDKLAVFLKRQDEYLKNINETKQIMNMEINKAKKRDETAVSHHMTMSECKDIKATEIQMGRKEETKYDNENECNDTKNDEKQEKQMKMMKIMDKILAVTNETNKQLKSVIKRDPESNKNDGKPDGSWIKRVAKAVLNEQDAKRRLDEAELRKSYKDLVKELENIKSIMYQKENRIEHKMEYYTDIYLEKKVIEEKLLQLRDRINDIQIMFGSDHMIAMNLGKLIRTMDENKQLYTLEKTVKENITKQLVAMVNIIKIILKCGKDHPMIYKSEQKHQKI